MHASASYISPTSETKNAVATTAAGAPITGTPNSGDIGVDALVPAIYSSYQVTDEIFLGLAVNSPFGLATENNDGWVGRYHATDSELMTIDFSPTAAYKPFDWLNLGAGLQVVYASATLENADSRIGRKASSLARFSSRYRRTCAPSCGEIDATSRSRRSKSVEALSSPPPSNFRV